ncbi:hypothetical protein GCK72_021534 [Caenorhabditis remanei]|uniref:Uncharacterized protein n=1 Tax=Caenorhabditis remanei TaxID=31234 RepID=E3MH74_CAERE|nr:hypothetical protein GCK72_021534 [Caenorhabditis remanei]EFP01782.1 hypothetical protein CRE_23382 [Caenorhabditis remanei]KAF1754968.1 hypothetical protein GCK72_021534 [Caenorhabditis remanei]
MISNRKRCTRSWDIEEIMKWDEQMNKLDEFLYNDSIFMDPDFLDSLNAPSVLEGTRQMQNMSISEDTKTGVKEESKESSAPKIPQKIPIFKKPRIHDLSYSTELKSIWDTYLIGMLKQNTADGRDKDSEQKLSYINSMVGRKDSDEEKEFEDADSDDSGYDGEVTVGTK